MRYYIYYDKNGAFLGGLMHKKQLNTQEFLH